MLIPLFALVLYAASVEASSQKCEPVECSEGFTFRQVASYTIPSYGQRIDIFECASPQLIKFYRVSLSGFSPHQGVHLDSVYTVMKRPIDIVVDECGDATITIYPTHTKRDFVSLDFVFYWPGMRVEMDVSKYLPRPEDDQASSSQTAKVEGPRPG